MTPMTPTTPHLLKEWRASSTLKTTLGRGLASVSSRSSRQRQLSQAIDSSYLTQHVPGAILHHSDIRPGFPKTDVVRTQASFVQIVWTAGGDHLGKRNPWQRGYSSQDRPRDTGDGAVTRGKVKQVGMDSMENDQETALDLSICVMSPDSPHEGKIRYQQ